MPLSQWRRGHLIAKSLGGAGGSEYRNLAAIYFLVNNSAMALCENRIRDALDCGHCVTLHVHAEYPSLANIFPTRIDIRATSPQGLNINVMIPNVAAPSPPTGATGCQAGGPNDFKT